MKRDYSVESEEKLWTPEIEELTAVSFGGEVQPAYEAL